MMQSYNYAHRKGSREISWQEFASLSVRLAEQLARFQPEVIVGVARAGLFPATAVACSLRRELFPVRLTRRRNDEVVYDKPVWKTPVPDEVAGRVVAIVDEIADTGETLALAAHAALNLGASQVVTACLVSHTWANPLPDISALVTDELVIFPWDRQVWIDGRWQPHPEIISALRLQGKGSQPGEEDA